MSKINTYGLLIERVNRFGTESLVARVVRREDGADFPKGCQSDPESSIWDSPKHLHGLLMDGLQLEGYIGKRDNNTKAYFLGFDHAEYHDTHSADFRKAEAMFKTLKKVRDAIHKSNSREPGDVFMALAKALKLSFAVVKRGDGHSSSYADHKWRWLTIEEGRNYLRQKITEMVAEEDDKLKARAA